MIRPRSIILLSVGVLLLAGIIAIFRVEIPIQTKFYDGGIGQNDELTIFLPGIGDDMDVFERAGFIDLLRNSPHATDSVVVDAHIGYYWNGSLPERLHQDVLMPFRERGYNKFILVGISLGGYGGLWVNDAYGDWIAGMVLISPLLGRKSVIEKIMAAGDVGSWRSKLDHAPGFDERVWVWIDDLYDPESGKISSLILAFGKEDKFRKAGEMLASSIPESHLFRSDGSHNWLTWGPLWAEITNSDSWRTLGSADGESDQIGNKLPQEKEAGRL